MKTEKQIMVKAEELREKARLVYKPKYKGSTATNIYVYGQYFLEFSFHII